MQGLVEQEALRHEILAFVAELLRPERGIVEDVDAVRGRDRNRSDETSRR